jgi:XTP/dITP diphosphohydrolase
MQRLVAATGNAGKLREIGALLAPHAIEVVAQSALGVPEAAEPHRTFIENALAKARHAAHRTGLPALADDSGICVDALGGEPGVDSAVYAGEPRSDARNNARLVEALRQCGSADRRAHYYCVVVYLRRADDPQPLIGEGEWHGEIAHAPRGAGGFGYDPWFLIPGLGRTVAELDAGQKNRLSHRARALAAIVERIRAGA